MAQHKGRADDRSPGTSLDHVQSHPHTPQISSDPPKGTGRRSLIRIEPTRAKETLRQPTLDLGEISAELESSLLSSLKAVQTTWRQAASEHRHGDIGRDGADEPAEKEPTASRPRSPYAPSHSARWKSAHGTPRIEGDESPLPRNDVYDHREQRARPIFWTQPERFGEGPVVARAAQTAARFRDPYGYGDSLRSERILRVEAPLAQPDLKAHGGPRPAVLAVVLLSLAAGGAGGLLGVGLFDASEPSVVAVVTSGDDATAAENDVPTAPMAAAEDSIAAESLLPAGDVGVDGGKPLLPAGSDDKPGLKGTPIAATVRDAPAELPAAVSEGAISRALPITWTEPDTIAESPAPLVDPLRQTTSLSYAREDRDARAVSPRVAILSSMASGSDPSKDHPLVANENENFATVKTAVNMRAKPNNNATVVTVLSSRRKVQIIECDYWCEVIADGKHGYVFRKFLDRSAMGVVSAR